MSDEPTPPLDDDLRDLLAAERRRGAAPPEATERVFERLRERVAQEPAPSSPPRASRAASVVLAGVGGMVAGAALHAALQPTPPPRVVERVVERTVERRVEVPVVRYVTVAPDAGSLSSNTPTRPRTNAQPPSPVGAEDDSALIDRARTALLRTSPSDALAALQEHARRFPRGQFAEEREALAVQTLVALRRPDEARARAASFHRQFPQSPLGAAVDESVRGLSPTP